MESPGRRSGERTTVMAEVRRSGAKAERPFSISALEVTAVVRYGVGPGSRIELTVGSAGRRVRLKGLRAKHVLSYGRIGSAAMEQGLVLPYERSANRAWRKVLSRAMERARVEPLLEGEEIADAVAEEIEALLGRGSRGESASDLMGGKVVELGRQLLVSPKSLVRAVRNRLVDDVLSQGTIAEAAAYHLGMRQTRHRFADARPHAWAFPLPFVAARENREAQESIDQGTEAGEASWIRSMDRRVGGTSPLPTEECELDPLDRAKKNRLRAGPARGGRVVSVRDEEMPSGTNGSRKNGRSHE